MAEDRHVPQPPEERTAGQIRNERGATDKPADASDAAAEAIRRATAVNGDDEG